MIWLPRALVLLASLLAAALSRRSPRLRALAFALGASLVLDLVRERASLPRDADLALYLATPALSAWCALVMLARRSPVGAALAVGVGWWLAAVVRLAPAGHRQAHQWRGPPMS